MAQRDMLRKNQITNMYFESDRVLLNDDRHATIAPVRKETLMAKLRKWISQSGTIEFLASIGVTVGGLTMYFQFNSNVPNISIGLKKFGLAVFEFLGQKACNVISAATSGLVFIFRAMIQSIIAVCKRSNRKYSAQKELNAALFREDMRQIWASNVVGGCVAAFVSFIVVAVLTTLSFVVCSHMLCSLTVSPICDTKSSVTNLRTLCTCYND